MRRPWAELPDRVAHGGQGLGVEGTEAIFDEQDTTLSGRSRPNRFRYRCSMNGGSGAFHGS